MDQNWKWIITPNKQNRDKSSEQLMFVVWRYVLIELSERRTVQLWPNTSLVYSKFDYYASVRTVSENNLAYQGSMDPCWKYRLLKKFLPGSEFRYIPIDTCIWMLALMVQQCIFLHSCNWISDIDTSSSSLYSQPPVKFDSGIRNFFRKTLLSFMKTNIEFYVLLNVKVLFVTFVAK